MLQLIARSLSLRLVGIFLLIGVLFVYGTLLSLRFIYQVDDVRELVSEHLSLHLDYVRNDIGHPPRIERALAITERVPVDIRLTGPDIDWASDAAFPDLSELEFGDSEIFSDQPDAWLKELRNVEFARRGHHRFLKIAEGDFFIIVSTPKIGDQKAAPDLRLIIVGFGLLLLLLGYFGVRWLFRPIKQIREGAAIIGAGNLSHRIANSRRDELGDLAKDVNAMADDVQAMLEAKRQLLLGISHELRTPLSRMRLGLEFLDDDDHRRGLREDIVEMEAIIATLLGAETLGSRHSALQIEEVGVANLLMAMIDEYFDRDRQRIVVTLQDPQIRARCDRARLLLLCKNIVSNALRYSPPDAGPVAIDVTSDGPNLIVAISDHGPGLTVEQRRRIGEPFYRGDPSRDRDTGGTGLGVYLARTIAIAHGGTLEVDEAYTAGARFVLTLPVLGGAGRERQS